MSPKIPYSERYKYLSIAEDLIRRGARVPIIVSLLPGSVNNKEVADLYQQINGKRSPTGPLPTSPDWYATSAIPWRAIQCSLFVNFFNNIRKISGADALYAEVMLGAYDMYVNHMNSIGDAPQLSFDRCWHLMKLVQVKSLILEPCNKCSHHFIMRNDVLRLNFVCGLCNRSSSLRPNNFNKKTELTEVGVSTVL